MFFLRKNIPRITRTMRSFVSHLQSMTTAYLWLQYAQMRNEIMWTLLLRREVYAWRVPQGSGPYLADSWSLADSWIPSIVTRQWNIIGNLQGLQHWAHSSFKFHNYTRLRATALSHTTERFTPGPFYTSSARTGPIFLQIFRAHQARNPWGPPGNFPVSRWATPPLISRIKI